MVQTGEIEHGRMIAEEADAVWNWSTPAGQLRARRRGDLIVKVAELGPSVRALEIGCGTGLFTRTFAKTGAEITAVDVSPELLDKAIMQQDGGRVSFEVADAECMDFPDNSFDAVVGSSVLHHLDVHAALAEIYRVLVPGGCMVFAEPNMMNPQIAAQRSIPALRRWAKESPHETAYIRWQLKRDMQSHGFADITVKPFDMLHPACPRPLIPTVRAVAGVLETLPLIREFCGSLIIRAIKPKAD